MNSSLVFVVVLTAALAGKDASRAPVTPFESPVYPTPQGKIDELVFNKLKRLGIPPAPLCSDAVFVRRVYLDVIGTLPTAQEAKAFLSDQNPKKRGKSDRSPAGAEGVCRLLGHEMVRSAAGQVRVSHQPVAQCGANLSPLDSDLHQGEHAVRSFRPGNAHRQRQQFPRAAGQLLPRRAKPRTAGHRTSRGVDLHGRAAGELAEGALVGDGGFLLARSTTRPPNSGKRRSFCSIPSKDAGAIRCRRRRRRPFFPMERRPVCCRVRIRARFLPIG